MSEHTIHRVLVEHGVVYLVLVGSSGNKCRYHRINLRTIGVVGEVTRVGHQSGVEALGDVALGIGRFANG